jgi:hypothetical protein
MVGLAATAITAASKPLFGKDGPFSGLIPGQQEILWLGVMGLVALVVVVDLVLRGHVGGRVSAAEECAPVVWFNPTRRAVPPAWGGAVVALRPSGEDGSGIQYLVIREPAPGAARGSACQTAWVGASLVAGMNFAGRFLLPKGHGARRFAAPKVGSLRGSNPHAFSNSEARGAIRRPLLFPNTVATGVTR